MVAVIQGKRRNAELSRLVGQQRTSEPKRVKREAAARIGAHHGAGCGRDLGPGLRIDFA